MKIFLHEITDQEKELDFSQEDAWIVQSVLRVDEKLEDSRPQNPLSAQPRLIQAHLSLRKVDEVIVISGRINTSIELVCSRCATLFQFHCTPAFSALFCKDPIMAGIAHLTKAVDGDRHSGRPQGQNSGFARHAHHFEEDQDDGCTSQDLDITYLSEDCINLADVISEQLQLQVPFQPLCKETCKGICSHCGADLNTGRCACSKIKSPTAFSVLRDYKI